MSLRGGRSAVRRAILAAAVLALAPATALGACAAGTAADHVATNDASGAGGAGGHKTGPSTTASAGGAAGAASSTSATATSATATSSASSATTGSGGAAGMPAQAWHRYKYAFSANGPNAWSRDDLATFWTSASAPPTTGILATIHFDSFDKLLVLSSDGNAYVEEGLDSGNWKALGPTATVFPNMAGAPVHAVFHVPDDWTGLQMPPPAAYNEGVTFVDNPAAYTYEYYKDDSVTFSAMAVATNQADAGGPDQAAGKALWAFNIWNKTKLGQADGYDTWMAYDDGNVYELKADFTWWSYPVAGGLLWAGVAGAPDWASIRAAYYVADAGYDGYGTLVFIGP